MNNDVTVRGPAREVRAASIQGFQGIQLKGEKEEEEQEEEEHEEMMTYDMNFDAVCGFMHFVSRPLFLMNLNGAC